MKCFSISITVILISVFCFLPQFTYASDPKALEIMKKVEEKETGNNAVWDMTMTLVDKNENERVRKIRSFSKKKGKESLSITFFPHPADVKNMNSLIHS